MKNIIIKKLRLYKSLTKNQLWEKMNGKRLNMNFIRLNNHLSDLENDKVIKTVIINEKTFYQLVG